MVVCMINILSIDCKIYTLKFIISEGSSLVPASKWRLGIGEDNIHFRSRVHHMYSRGQSMHYFCTCYEKTKTYFLSCTNLVYAVHFQVLTLKTECLLPANPDILDGVDDLMQLSYLNEPSVLYNLQYRYSQNMIYVSASIEFNHCTYIKCVFTSNIS